MPSELISRDAKMPKYIVCYDAPLRERKYLTKISNKRPYFSRDRVLAREYDTLDDAKQAEQHSYWYSGYALKVQEV